jgi:2-dehydropantoate 2-reductase
LDHRVAGLLREESRMRITIVGAGAMGCLFGAYLFRAGEDVALVDSWIEHVEALRRGGLRLQEGGELLTFRVPAYPAGEAIRPAELVLLFVKANHTRSTLEELPALLAPGGAVLTLQNGLGSGDLLSEALGADSVLVGVTAQGATRLGPAAIRHGGSGETIVGAFRGEHPLLGRAAETFSRAGLPARAVRDIRPLVWKKLAVNCGINALTALTGIRNGRVPEIPAAATLLRDAVAEVAAVGRAAGVELGEASELGEQVLAVATATAENRSSMGQDVDRRAPTEIDFINGAIVREGERLGVATPVNAVFTRLVKTLEATFEGGT